MYINKVFIYGNLTRDPELKSTPSGAQVAQFSVATNRVYKDRNGAKQEEVQFHNCVVWAQQADTLCRYMKKGSAIFVEGRLQTRSWDGKDGTKQYRTEIVVENFQFGPKATGGAPSDFGGAPRTSAAPSQAPAAQAPELDTIEYPTDDINPDDIPF
jgi:single-strand DNA-binding protein